MQRQKSPQYNSISTSLIIEAFKSTGYLIVNKTFIKKFGLIPSIILSNYIDKFQYFRSKNESFDGWFFLRHGNIMEQLNLKESTLSKVKKELIALGILLIKKKGVPAKEWIYINFPMLVKHAFPDPEFFGGLDPELSGGLDPELSGGLYKETKIKEYNTSNEKTDLNGVEKITLGHFSKFWGIWPPKRRGSKGKALASWIKACSPNNEFRPSWQVVRGAIKKQKKSQQWGYQNGKWIPLAVADSTEAGP